MVRLVLTGRLTGLGFDLAWFSSHSLPSTCVSSVVMVLYNIKFFVTFFTIPSELILVGSAITVVD